MRSSTPPPTRSRSCGSDTCSSGPRSSSRRRGSPPAAVLAAVLLATDWAFGFYKAALGGTELLLQIAVLLGVTVLVGKGRCRTLAAAMALGLLAKLAFVPVAGVMAIVYLATGHRPARRELALGLAAIALAALPYVVGAVHQASI